MVALPAALVPSKLKGKGASAPTARPKVPMRRRGADCLLVAMKRV
jgi:hypothetical protein